MRKTLFSIIMITVLILVVGLGCNKTNGEETASYSDSNNPFIVENIDKETMDAKGPTDEEMDEMKIENFNLKAQAIGNQTVRFEWEVPQELAREAEGYRFARGEEENPTYPSNWWWERGPAHRKLEWEGLPLGNTHFRVCVVKDDECTIYSNDVEVEVK